MLVDAEHCFDPYYSKALGVDVESLIVCQPDNGEMALESGFHFSSIISI
jgi:recombination protein RecA